MKSVDRNTDRPGDFGAEPCVIDPPGTDITVTSRWLVHHSDDKAQHFLVAFTKELHTTGILGSTATVGAGYRGHGIDHQAVHKRDYQPQTPHLNLLDPSRSSRRVLSHLAQSRASSFRPRRTNTIKKTQATSDTHGAG